MSQLSALEILAQAAFYHSNMQKDFPMQVNQPISFKKRTLLRYHHEQMNKSRTLSPSSYTSGSGNSTEVYSNSSPSTSKSSFDDSTKSSSPYFDRQMSGYEDRENASPKAKRSRTKNKKYCCSPSSEVKENSLQNQSIESNITEKLEILDNSKSPKIDLENEVLDEDLMIKVKTPVLTYTLRNMRKRKASNKTPDCLKNEEYYEKRHRNNLAAKKSRNNKNLAIKTSVIRLKQLEDEQEKLRKGIGRETKIMRFMQEKMASSPAIKSRVLELIKAKDLTHFNKILTL